MSDGANESIRYRLQAEPGSKWGFLIYRCTYASDEKWARFMDYLNTLVRVDLERNGIGDCFDRLDWCVQEKPEYEGMLPEQARIEFKKWIESGAEKNDGSARFMACICADEVDVNCVAEMDEPPETGDPRGWMSLDLVSVNEEEGDVAVGIGYLCPRAYVLIEDPGWWIVYRDDGDVSLP